MSQSPFKTKEFKAQFTEWNKKLIDEGHAEIENFELPDPALKTWHKHDFIAYSLTAFEEKQRYFELAQKVLNTFKFESKEQRMIWELHAEGYTLREIAKKMNRKKFKKDAIRAFIERVKASTFGNIDSSY